jgi:lipopolysaccharide/colanic/teichoic acid biosynthesis glycosyltransferase
MSLVGPRPEVPRYVQHYPPALRERALAVRPGITDPSSLDFIDEAELLAGSRRPRARVHRDASCRASCSRGRLRGTGHAVDRPAVIGRTLRVLWRA